MSDDPVVLDERSSDELVAMPQSAATVRLDEDEAMQIALEEIEAHRAQRHH